MAARFQSSSRPMTIGCVLASCALWVLGLPQAAPAAFGLEKSFPLSQPAAEPMGPSDLEVGPDHSIYVANRAEIQRYDRDGRLLNRWGGRGTAPGKFSESSSGLGALSIAVDPVGAVYAYDIGNDRVQKFTATGQFIRSIARAGAPGTEPRAFFDRAGMATDRQGNLFVADGRGMRKLSPSGVLLASRTDLDSAPIAAGSPGLYLGGGVLVLLDQFTLAYRSTLAKVGTNDVSAARTGVWADSRDLILFSPSGKVRQVCKRPNTAQGPPAVDGSAVYSVSGGRVQRYGPNAPVSRACDALAPSLTRVRLSGRTLRYRLSEPGRVVVRLQSRRRGRYRTVKRTSFRSRQGARRKRVLSRRLTAPLPRGRYRIVVRAIDEAGNRSPSRRLTLRFR